MALKFSLLAAGFLALLSTLPVSAIDCTFSNPLIPTGQDPSVVYHDGYYYLVESTGTLMITRSETLTGLGSVRPVAVYTPPTGEDYSHDLWAPEIVYLQGHWYIYVAATNAPGNNPTHRTYVLRADTDDPLGSWTMMGKLTDPTDKWAIDAIPFEFNGQLYVVWSGWPGDIGDFPQNLYIAEMSDPLTISSERVLISTPDQPWEQTVAAINEGPQVFIHEDTLSIVYAADSSWTRAYKLGLLTLTGDDPMNPDAWTKTGPVMQEFADVYGPGHSSNPVPSPDGSEDWFLYHAIVGENGGWQDRNIRMQRFTWAEDGTPVFGDPIPAGVAQTIPSGEPCGLVAQFDNVDLSEGTPAPTPAMGSYIDTGEAFLNTQGSFSVAATVELNSINRQQAFVSQEGGLSSNFVLGLTDDGQFAFTMFNGFGQNSSAAVSENAPESGEEYQLVGVYNAAQQQLELYVNGELQGTAPFTEGWRAQAHTIIGAARRQSQRVDFFDGQIRSVLLFAGALDTEEVQQLSQ